jgi:hypothetical protein
MSSLIILPNVFGIKDCCSVVGSRLIILIGTIPCNWREKISNLTEGYMNHRLANGIAPNGSDALVHAE